MGWSSIVLFAVLTVCGETFHVFLLDFLVDEKIQ